MSRMNMLRVCCFVSVLALFGGSTVHAQSLFEEATFKPLTGDHKAFKVGDVLTVQVFENSSATSSADTGTRRKNGIHADIDRDGNQLKQFGVSVSGDFDGGGRTQRSNRVLAIISVTVKQVFANGDLSIAGEQSLTVNEEVQRVNIEGRVRPVDVSDANIVLSTRIADAKITYLGEGDLSERQKRSLWRKLVDWLGL